MRTAHVVVLVFLAGCATNRNTYTPLEETTLSDRIEDQFDEDGRLEDAKIRVTTDDGVVVLAGTVESLDDAVVAARIAGDTPGVVAVLNELRVRDEREAPVMTPAYDQGSEGE